MRRSPASPQVVRSSCFAVTLGLRVAREQRHGVPPDSELNSERAVAVRNLQRKAPKHAREEIADDFHRVVDAESEAAARVAWTAFEKKWRPRCPGAVKSLAEGGDELLTFFRYPKSQWKTIRTTNVIERLNGEFRRRVKTQGSLPGENAALVLLFGLVASGQIKLRKLDGFRRIADVLSLRMRRAA